MSEPENYFDINPLLYQYNDSIIKVVQYQPDKWVDVLKFFFTYVIDNPELTFSVTDIPSTNSKKLTFKYSTSSITNTLNLHDYLIVKSDSEGNSYLEAVPQAILESSYTLYDESSFVPPSSASNNIPKDFVNKVWNKGDSGDNWWITSLQVLAHETEPTKKANIEAYFADPKQDTVKTETFTLELGDGLEFSTGSTTNSIKIIKTD
jgi:hypothetical protein